MSDYINGEEMQFEIGQKILNYILSLQFYLRNIRRMYVYILYMFFED